MPALVATALALRLTYYLMNPSLSNDEASLALNLIHRSYPGLLGRLDFNQAAPPGFLLLQKLATDVFGPSPYSLRLLPFLAGAAACLLVYPVAARVAGRRAAIVALALFAVSDPVMSYASTNKQYSVDVAVVLVLSALTLAIRDRLHTRETVLLGVVGVTAVLVSHPAAFVLVAIWTLLAVDTASKHRWRELASLAGVAAVWLGCLATAYVLTSASIEQIQRSAALGWGRPYAAAQTLGGMARYLLGIPAFAPEVRAAITCTALLLCLVGLRALSQKSIALAIVLAAPAVIAGAAVWIGRYPSFPRTFLFVVPSLILLVAIGVDVLVARRRRGVVRAGAGVAAAVLIGVGATQTIRHLRASEVTELTHALSYLTEHARSGDSLYVSRPAQYTFRYYLECGCFANARVVAKARATWPVRPAAGYGQFDAALESTPPSLIAGTSTGFSERDYAIDFAPLLGRTRVWILVVDPHPSAFRALNEFLRNRGRLLDVFPKHEVHGVATLFLYTLRPNQ